MISIQHDDKIMKVPSDSLPIYRILYEQMGFTTKWDSQKRTLNLSPLLQDKKIYIVAEAHDFLDSILEKIQTYFRKIGIAIIQLKPNSTLSKAGELSLHITYTISDNLTSQFYISYSGSHSKSWALILQREFEENGFYQEIKQNMKKKPSIPLLEIQCHIPASTKNMEEVQENITQTLISALLRGLTREHPWSLLPYTSADTLSTFLFHSKGDQPAPIQPATMTKSAIPLRAEREKRNLTHISPNQMNAEVYLDYQILVPNEENTPFLVIGSIYIKNTGTSHLLNPVICIHTAPKENVKLSGQIIPPKQVENLGVQSFDGNGVVGWRYLEDDWFEKANQRGEYWVRPIQSLQISPGDQHSFPNFQLSIPKPKDGVSVTIQAIVFFQEQDLQFPSHNKIVLSF
ncbi:hypothetical protein [Thermoactinomyces sp. DSM 45892]|uniref:hypothetical protein n=1 Tax=Thermoactinomyces sp. DSM 45892 TaxID=1882753 RepID=UPI000895ADAE|nr:hypothetical protein [Thermoactinomyces sp. DSM 45892]SDZ36082.1 hypothetical protein SAMN05444416_12518 [Thermoactinomyces sp. DSM 45892]